MDKKTLALLSSALLTSLTTGNSYAGNGNTYTDYARVIHVEPVFRYVTVREPQRHCEVIRRNHASRHHPHHPPAGTRSRHHHSGDTGSAIFIGGVIGGAIGRHVTRSVNGRASTGGTVAGAVIGSTLASSAARRQLSPQRHERNYGYQHLHSTGSRQHHQGRQNQNSHRPNRHHRNHGNTHGHRHHNSHNRERCVTTTVSRQERRRDGYNVTYVYKGQTLYTKTDHHPGDSIKVRVQIKPH